MYKVFKLTQELTSKDDNYYLVVGTVSSINEKTTKFGHLYDLGMVNKISEDDSKWFNIQTNNNVVNKGDSIIAIVKATTTNYKDKKYHNFKAVHITVNKQTYNNNAKTTTSNQLNTSGLDDIPNTTYDSIIDNLSSFFS